MITGVVSADRDAVIVLKVGCATDQEETVNAIIDTGFKGYLTLPPSLIARLGCVFLSRGFVTLGDGRREQTDLYEATVEWDGQDIAIETDEADSDPLVGMGLLYGYKPTIETVDGGPVVIERI